MNWDAIVGLGLLLTGLAASAFLIWRDVRSGRRQGGSQQ